MRYTDAQSKAIHTKGKNIIVSAGAGSGKTGVLMARVIEKLKQGIHLDELIILTFTNAAAFEMKSRITKAIKDSPNLKSELIKLNSAIITTFDAFCLRLVREYHYLLNLPSDIGITDRILLLDLEQNILEETIKSYYLANDKDFEELVINLYQRGDQIIYDTVSQLAKKISKEPNYSDILNNYEALYLNDEFINNKFDEFELYIKKLLNNTKTYYLNTVNQLISYMDNPKVEIFLNEINHNLKAVLEYKTFDGLIESINKLQLPKKLSIKGDDDFKSILDNTFVPMRDCLNEIKSIFNDAYIDSRSEGINNVFKTKGNITKIIEVTKEYLKRLRAAKFSLNRFDYADIMNFAIELIENNLHIKDSFKKTIKEIMIDEYQDTNDLQEYFISLIANDNLFMVGDMKQSIYGFRDANPENFLKKYHQYQNSDKGIGIDLRANFRSRKQVLVDINTCFNNVMSQEIGGINYQDNQSLIYGQKQYDSETKNQKYGVEVIKYDYKSRKQENSDLSKTDIEAELLVKDIRTRIDNHYQINDIKANKIRELKYSDIAILLDRATDFELITKYLSKYNIPVNLYSNEPFFESPEMLFITNYLKLLKCFIDQDYLKENFKTVFYSVSRSFVYQIEDRYIINILIHEDMNCIEDITKLLEVKVFHNLIETAIAISKKLSELPIDDLLIEIYRELDFYSKLSYLDNPGKKLDKVDYFTQNIQSFNLFNINDLIEYLELVETNRDWDIEYSKANNQYEAVNLMTMHKSKGLEFPIVYVMGLDKKFNFQENRDFFVFDKEYGLIANIIEDGYFPSFLRYLYLYQAKIKYVSERIRLLYVTFTRAKENLILIINENSIKPEYQTIDSDGYINTDIRSKYQKFTDLISSTQLSEYPYSLKADEILVNELTSYKPETKLIIEKKAFNYKKVEVEKLRYSKSNLKLIDDSNIELINYGQNIHEDLEYIDFYNFESSTKQLPDRIRTNLVELIDSKLINLELKPQIYQEYSFYDTITNKNGIIDLMIEYSDRILIIDYKLKNIDDEAYENQLKGYYNFVNNKTNKRVECYLFAILSKTIKKII